MRRPCNSTIGCCWLIVALGGTLLVAGCGGSASTSTGPTVVKCQISLGSAANRIGPEGGSSSVDVVAQPECTWAAASAVSWITDLSPASGQGGGRIDFRVAPNPQAASRQGDITVNEQRLQVLQEPMPCRFEITPVTQSLPVGGGSGSVAVVTASDCSWNASSNADWITITSGANGSGNGAVRFSVAANPGPSRAGTLTVAGQTVTVSQGLSCGYSINQTSQTFSAPGGTGALGVSAPDACGWTATSNATWITITSGATGSGSGSVGFSVAANTGVERTGTLTIAGQVFKVLQAIGCSYSITPTAQSIAAAGGASTTVGVSTAAGCAWTAASNASWITITSGSAGSGNGAVTFTAAANASVSRTGTLTIAGQMFTVAQDSGCSWSINPTNQSIGSAGGTGTLGVSTAAGCAWTATSNASWLNITAGATGIGNGGVTFSVQPNTGAARNGTLTVAGQNFTVSQASGCTYSISPTSQAFSAAGGSGTVTVTAGSGCAWTANSNAGWIAVTSGTSGGGNGTVTYLVTPNTTGSTRTGTLTIAGQTVTVTESH